jgi:hypothetical protein
MPIEIDATSNLYLTDGVDGNRDRIAWARPRRQLALRWHGGGRSLPCGRVGEDEAAAARARISLLAWQPAAHRLVTEWATIAARAGASHLARTQVE